ncbi:MAG: hypothetical protein HY708_04245, partial [Ignavibacteriae bacterium]|nr:hypothetical protein [Ignavibacteriota bacterium]
TTLRELRAFQRPNGGFAYWPASVNDSPYPSAFAMYVLALAKQRGFSIDESVMKKGLDYVRNVLRWEDKLPNYPYTSSTWASTKTLILYTLALLNAPEPAYYEYYMKNLERIPLFARASLLKAISASTRNKRMTDAIVNNLVNNIKVSPTSAHCEEPNVTGLEWCWSSNTRTTALLLEALLEADGFPDGVLPSKMVKWLLQRQHSGRWDNTQENAYVVHALATYYSKFERTEPHFTAEIRVAGDPILKRAFEGWDLKGYRIVRDLDEFQRNQELPVVASLDGVGTLFAGIRMTYHPTDAAAQSDEGIAIIKNMEPMRKEETRNGKTTFAAGSIVRVTLRVITPQARNFVVIDDPLPAGLEAINTSLKTESAELALGLNESHEMRSGYRWWGSFNHSEFHDDRVLLFADKLDGGVHTFSYLARATTYGKFAMPATYGEQMYEPEVFGRTSETSIEIK